MAFSRLVCVVVDGWHLGYVGAYGNDWVGTPELDRLAGESLLLDQAYAACGNAEACWRALLLGQHPRAPSANAWSLIESLNQAGVETWLITDDPEWYKGATSFGFSKVELLMSPAESCLADEIEDVALLHQMAQVLDHLDEARPRMAMFVHLSSLRSRWDAPLDIREQFLQDEEVPLYEGTQPPSEGAWALMDDDAILAARYAYGAQVSVADAALGPLFDWVRATEDTVFTMLGLRGCCLGEHPQQPSAGALYSEQVHIPWYWRVPDSIAAAARSQTLASHLDLAPTVCDLLQISHAGLPAWGKSLLPILQGEPAEIHDRLWLGSRGERRAIRTPAWYLIDQEPAPELYVKPDDRYEQNEVASLLEEVCLQLTALLDTPPAPATDAAAPPQQPLSNLLLYGAE